MSRRWGLFATAGVVLAGLLAFAVWRMLPTQPWPAILTSTDGVHWQVQRKGDFSGVTFGLGRFVAIGDAGQIATSTDGRDWTYLSPVKGKTLSAVAYGDGRFVAVGAAGTIVTSSDGLHWDQAFSPTTYNLHTIAYGNGRFIAVGDGEEKFYSSNTLLASGDGVHWTTSQKLGTVKLVRHIAYGSGHFVVITKNDGWADLFFSPDGVKWTERRRFDPDVLSLTYGPDQFVAVGIGDTFTSVTGAEWVKHPWPAEPHLFVDQIVYAGGEYIAAGTQVIDGVFCTSADGIHWAVRAVVPRRPLRGVAYGNGQYVALAWYDWGIH